jgi:AcrR family transcriptional regulator
MTQADTAATRTRTRRAGRSKVQVLEAACRVIAARGADATRFADVAAESAVPVSTLQYYFGSREDLLVAAFRHASGAEIASLAAELAAISDPWECLSRIVLRAIGGYAEGAAEPGRLWIESWHFGIRDAEMRADTLRDYAAWRRLVTDAVRAGIRGGQFTTTRDPERIAVLAIALADGVGIPLVLGDPQVTPAQASQDVLSALADLLRPSAAPRPVRRDKP